MSEAENGGRRFLALAAVQTLLVGLLAGVLQGINPFSSGYFATTGFDPGLSDLAPVLADVTVDAVLALVVVLYVVVPWFVFANADLADRRRAALVGGAALLGLPPVGVFALTVGGGSLVRAVTRLPAFGIRLVMTGGGFAVLVAVAVGCKAAFESGARSEESFHVEAASLGTVLSLLLIAGLAVGTPVGAAIDDATFVVGDSMLAKAEGTFTYHYERTDDGRAVLTIRHDGGPSIPADELYIEGDSVVAVDGANQTETGRWQGSTVRGADGPMVDAGNAVTVGVSEGCVVRVVRRDEADAATVGKYECPG